MIKRSFPGGPRTLFADDDEYNGMPSAVRLEKDPGDFANYAYAPIITAFNALDAPGGSFAMHRGFVPTHTHRANGKDNAPSPTGGAHPEVATATTTVTGAAVNNAPVARAGDYAATEDQTLVVNPAANGHDDDADTLTITGFNALSDGQGSVATATVTLNVAAVNDAPVAADDAYAATEDETLVVNAAAGVLANDSDVEGDALTISAFDAQSIYGGTVAVNPDGGFSYTPAPNFNGSDTFSYTVDDGNGGSASATVSLTVAAVNDAPVAAADRYPATEDTTLIVNAAAGVLANDQDIDGDTLTVTSFDALSAQGGTVAMNADGGFSYTPAGNFNGEDSFSYTVDDGNGGSATATVTLKGVVP